jgi:hypothetical protein
VFSVLADGTGLRRESPAEVSDSRPQWSPDGAILLAHRWGPGTLDTVLMSDGTQRIIANIALTNWSPDQTKLIVKDEERIVTFDVETEEQADLGVGREPDWRAPG